MLRRKQIKGNMMPRKVIITMEVETDAPLKVLINSDNWPIRFYLIKTGGFQNSYASEVLQIQANVIKEGKKG